MKWNPFKKPSPVSEAPIAYEVEIGVFVAGGKESIVFTLPGQRPGPLSAAMTEFFVREAKTLQSWAARIQARVDKLQAYVDASKDRCVAKDKVIEDLKSRQGLWQRDQIHYGLQVKRDVARCAEDSGKADPAEKLAFTAWLDGEHAVLAGKVASLKLEEQALQARLKSLRAHPGAAETKKAGKGKAK